MPADRKARVLEALANSAFAVRQLWIDKPVFQPVVEVAPEGRIVGHRGCPGCCCSQEPVDRMRNRLRIRSDRFVAEFERGIGTQNDRRPEIPRVVAKPLGGGFVEQHFIPLVTERPGDRSCDLTRVWRIGVGTVEEPLPWHAGYAFHKGGCVDRRCLAVPAQAGIREEHRGPFVEYTLHEHPFPRAFGSLPMDLGCPDHIHGMTAVQKSVLGGDLVGPVSLAGVVSPPPGFIVGSLSMRGDSKRGATSELTWLPVVST